MIQGHLRPYWRVIATMKNRKISKAITAVAVAGLIPLSFMGNAWIDDGTTPETFYQPSATYTFALAKQSFERAKFVSNGYQVGQDYVDEIVHVIYDGETDGELYGGYLNFYVFYGNMRDDYGPLYPAFSYHFENQWVPVGVLHTLWSAESYIETDGDVIMTTNIELQAGDFSDTLTATNTETINGDGYMQSDGNEDTLNDFIEPFRQSVTAIDGDVRDYVFVRQFGLDIRPVLSTLTSDVAISMSVYPTITDDTHMFYWDYVDDVSQLMEDYTNVTFEQVVAPSPTDLLFSPIDSFLKLELFPGFTVETLFIIAVAIGVFGVFLKFYAGG